MGLAGRAEPGRTTQRMPTAIGRASGEGVSIPSPEECKKSLGLGGREATAWTGPLWPWGGGSWGREGHRDSPHTLLNLCSPVPAQEHLSVSHNHLTTLHGDLSSLPSLRVSAALGRG